MPQFNAYPTSTELLADDTILMWSDADGAVQQISGENLATALQLLWNPNLTVNILSSNTVLTSDYQFVQCNSGSTFTLTIPDSDSEVELLGKPFYISNKGAGTVTLQRSGSDTIGGATSLAIAQGESVIIISDGAGYWSTFGAP